MVDLDLEQITKSCERMRKVIQDNFANLPHSYEGKGTETTYVHSYYNLLLYPYNGFHDLYHAIRTLFFEVNPTNDKYYIQCWLNYFMKDDYMSWHGHKGVVDNKLDTTNWHGFFCVNCEPSVTTYRIQSTGLLFDIDDKNNQLVLSKSHDDLHRTYPWKQDTPRITIAFDIISQNTLKDIPDLNHWMPL